MQPDDAPPPRKRKRRPSKDSPSLSSDRIISAALELIDTRGVENFSMRNLAKMLDVYPMAIYWYVPNRDALVARLTAHVLADLVPEAYGADWRDDLRTLLHRFRAIIRAHPNVAPLIGAQLVSNASVNLGMIEWVLEVLRRSGLAEADLPAAYNATIGAMVGYVTQEFAAVPEDNKTGWAEGLKEIAQSADPGQYPLTAALMPQLLNRSFILRWENGSTVPLDDGFDLFVESFIAGLGLRAGH
ncbi:MAG: TetR/AcrR family transcriptional regulator [Pseudomonadota bacterium]|nr:TetR/AcrR family transcriptional regulator [Pseudomonadota bacterium]